METGRWRDRRPSIRRESTLGEGKAEEGWYRDPNRIYGYCKQSSIVTYHCKLVAL
jgi:hypothetical protein